MVAKPKTNAATIKVIRSDRMITPVGRASFPDLFTPSAFNDDATPKYGVSLLIDKDQAGNNFVKVFKAAQEDALSELYPSKRPNNLEYWGLVDGDESNDTYAENCWIIRAKSNSKPAVIDQRREPITEPEVVYAGCDIRMSICAKAYGTATRGGVTAELVAVQFVGDNEPFGGAAAARANAVNEFDDIDDGQL
jgi:Protein of unknown function (DUF2815)